MKLGDISNESVSAIGIRFEGVVELSGNLNRAAKTFIDDIFLKDLNLFLITLKDRRKVMAFCYKWGIAYNGVLQADSILEIPELCEAHQLIAYFDADSKILETVGNRGTYQTETRLWTAREIR